MNIFNNCIDKLQPNKEKFVRDPFYDAFHYMNKSDNASIEVKKGEIIESIEQNNLSELGELLNKEFTIVSYNAQKLADNLWNFFENNANNIDIILVQEPSFNIVKKIVSTTNKNGDEYENTISHQ